MPAQTKIVQPSFNITTPGIPGADKQLFVELSWQGISFYCLHTAAKEFTDYVVYLFPPGTTDTDAALLLKDILPAEPLMQEQYKKTDIIYAFPECVLTPHEVYNAVDNTRMLDTIFGDTVKSIVKTDFVYRRNLHAVYRVPVAVNAAIASKFPAANSSHLYSLLPDAIKVTGKSISLVCFPNRLLMMLQDGEQLKIIQQYETVVPEDAACLLLNLCRCFDYAPAEITLQVWGMIDEGSAMYNELYKYFLNIKLATRPEAFTYAVGFAAYPAHYFSHSFSVAACV